MKSRMLALSCLLLTACAAVGVPETSDPWKKYLYACALMDGGRIYPAARLLRQSLDYYEKSDEPLRLAMVQMQYAILVESPAFVVSGGFAKDREAIGGRDALPARARQLNAAAADNLRKALADATARQAPADRTQALLVLNEAQERLGERREACETVDRAQKTYTEAAGIEYRYAIYSFKSVPEYLDDRRKRLACPG